MRKSSRRSDQRRPPRATEPPRRCTPSTRGECTKISNCGRGSGVSGICVGSSLNDTYGLVRQEVVRAQHRLHDAQEAAQDAVLVERVDGVDRLLDLAPRTPSAPPRSPVRVEARVEELARARRATPVCAEQRLLHVAVAERDPGLAQVARDRAQHRHLAPVEPGAEDQPVEAVELGLAVPDAREALVEALADRVGVDRRPARLQPEVVDPHGRAVARRDLGTGRSSVTVSPSDSNIGSTSESDTRSPRR